MSRSIYQNNGKPLSQQAIYQQKLKQGIYNTPGIPSVGVNSNASDTAALLAASSDLTVKPSYERIVAKEAHTAALAAKKENIEPWSRGSTDPDADAAAASARSNSSRSSGADDQGSRAGTGISATVSSSIYKAANVNSTASISHRINPEKDIKRSGLAARSATAALDIDKINQVANQQSTKSLSSRFNPELDYRSGLKVKSQQPAEYLNTSEEKLAATSAAASLKHGGGFTDQVSAQRRTSLRAADFVNGTLLTAASNSANDRLKYINSSTPVDFKQRAQAYANALAIAQKNSDERIKNNNAGLIHLGGGLTITQSEMDKLASQVVQPVLDDMNIKAENQREYDNLKKKKHEELVVLHEKAKQEEVERVNKEKQEIEAAKQERVAANDNRKVEAEGEYATYQTGRNEEVQLKVTELKEAEAKYAEEKEALLKEKQENEDRIAEEEGKLIEQRKTELEEVQAEKDEILKPILAELEEENEKLKTVTDARDQLASEVEAAEKLNSEYEEKLTQLNEKLETTQKEIEEYTVLLENSTKEDEETTAQLETLKQTASEEQTKAGEESKELDGKIDELNKQKQEHLGAKATQKEEIKKKLNERVKDEHTINRELPEHLQKDVNEKALTDTGSLFSAETPVKETKHEIKASEPPTPKENSKLSSVPVKSRDAPDVSNGTSGGFKKKIGLKRLSKFLKSPASPKKSDVGASNAVHTESKPQVNHKREVSAVSNFSDDISLGRQKNEGGVFREEI